VRIIGGPTRSTKDRTPTFAFASTLKKLKYGKHTFSVTAVSAANKQSAPATRSFKVKRKRRR
jgi:hypothetical protein